MAKVAYIPNETIIGLSKINRIVRFFAQRPQVQERLTHQIMASGTPHGPIPAEKPVHTDQGDLSEPVHESNEWRVAENWRFPPRAYLHRRFHIASCCY